LTVLVGPNASGKTSVLESLLVLAELGSTSRYSNVVRRIASYSSSSKEAKEDVSFEGEGDSGTLSLSIAPERVGRALAVRGHPRRDVLKHGRKEKNDRLDLANKNRNARQTSRSTKQVPSQQQLTLPSKPTARLAGPRRTYVPSPKTPAHPSATIPKGNT
jgi:predicted ATP-dependent endonuclease of OLD family